MHTHCDHQQESAMYLNQGSSETRWKHRSGEVTRGHRLPFLIYLKKGYLKELRLFLKRLCVSLYEIFDS